RRLPKNQAIREGFGTVIKGRFSETLGIEALKGAEDGGHTHFSCRDLFGSRRRHIKIDGVKGKYRKNVDFNVTSSGAKEVTT
ncbi:hypothetical protein PRIPAC_78321, partial [Pristionchus pacificus]|uniref:Uncharacterized protein n=1 Tax=Pristionchus pacificus TaxID=54126 RepID=A0A2A6CNU9_PRIPA